jgi:hypothetical protein
MCACAIPFLPALGDHRRKENFLQHAYCIHDQQETESPQLREELPSPIGVDQIVQRIEEYSYLYEIYEGTWVSQRLLMHLSHGDDSQNIEMDQLPLLHHRRPWPSSPLLLTETNNETPMRDRVNRDSDNINIIRT